MTNEKHSFVARKGGSHVYESEEDRRVWDIVHVMAAVPSDEYTADGKPFVESIERLLGYDITEAERDAAFDIFKREVLEKHEARVAAEADETETPEELESDD